MDQRWRARAVRELRLQGRETLLDLCTGTADVALAAVRRRAGAARVIGVDFSPGDAADWAAEVPPAGRLAPRGAGLRGCHAHPVAGLFGGRGHHRLWHPQRPGHGGGVPRAGTRRAYGRASGGARVRPSAPAGLSCALPLVLASAAAGRSGGWCRGTRARTSTCPSRWRDFRRPKSSGGCSSKAGFRTCGSSRSRSASSTSTWPNGDRHPGASNARGVILAKPLMSLRFRGRTPGYRGGAKRTDPSRRRAADGHRPPARHHPDSRPSAAPVFQEAEGRRGSRGPAPGDASEAAARSDPLRVHAAPGRADAEQAARPGADVGPRSAGAVAAAGAAPDEQPAVRRGNTPEYVEKSPPPQPQQQARQPGPPQPPTPDPAQNAASNAQAANTGDAFRLPEQANHQPASRDTTPAGGRPNTGPLSEAIRNLSRYTEQAAFDNPNGGNNSAFGPFIQFDSKGVEFGPWIRRFIAQVKRNWFVPYAAMSLRGHVVITFNVHKTGALTEVDGHRSVRRRVVQLRRVQRARDIEPDRAAAARVPDREGVLHRHLLLQRASARRTVTCRRGRSSVDS